MSKPMRSIAAVLLAGVMIDGQGGRQVLVPVWSWVRTLPRQAMLFLAAVWIIRRWLRITCRFFRREALNGGSG